MVSRRRKGIHLPRCLPPHRQRQNLKSGSTGLLWVIAAAVVIGVIVLGVLRYLGKI